MLPLVFLPDTPVLLAGRGPAFEKRLGLLRGAGIRWLRLFSELPPEAEVAAVRLVFGAGLAPEENEALAAAARARGVPVNIEDVPHLCDFHVPALVRRGDLLLSISTGGAAPGLAGALRGWLEEAFGPEWAEHLQEVAELRARLRAAGASPAEVMHALRAQLDAAGWAPLAADGTARCRPLPAAVAGQRSSFPA
jgi:precorrin-2 dehydrogenase/sirohydrochlorin ferrochelatase